MHYSNSTCSAGCVVLRVASAVILYSSAALAIDNGIGVTPPRGWRSWNQFGTGIHQDLIEAQYEALANRSRLVDSLGGLGPYEGRPPIMVACLHLS